MIEGRDLYGAEMNLASKLGEDIARGGEIFLTDAAHARLQERQARLKRPPPATPFELRQIPLSSLTIKAYRLTVP